MRTHAIDQTDRNFALAMHLTPLLGMTMAPPLFLAPLVLWLVRRERSPFNDDHGREVINFGISMFLFTVLFSWTIVIPFALFIVSIVSLIRGAVAAGRDEYFRYPLTIRFLR